MGLLGNFKKFLKVGLIAATLSSFSSRTSAAEIGSQDFLGTWVFVGFIYEGVTQPPRDPRLHLEFNFYNDGTSRLYWTRTEGQSYCERKAIYMIRDSFLLEEINWVNPENEITCGEDPDMKMGRRTETKVRLNEEGQFELYLSLGDKDLIYLFEKR